MKLKAKISLIFCALFFVAMSFVALASTTLSEIVLDNQIENGRLISTEIAGSQLSQAFASYKAMVIAASSDETMMKSNNATELTGRVSELASIYGFVSGNVLDKNGKSYSDGTDFSDRQYVQRALTGETVVSEVTLSKLTGNYGFSVAGPLYDTNKAVRGVIYFRMEITAIQELLSTIKVSTNGYAYIIDGSGMVISHANQDYINTMNAVDEFPGFGEVVDNIAKGQDGDFSYEYLGEKYNCSYIRLENTDNWGLIVVTPEKDCKKTINTVLNQVSLLNGLVWIVVAIVCILVGSKLGKQVEEVSTAIGKLANGDFSAKLEKSDKKDEIAVLKNSAVILQDTFTKIINEENRILGAIVNYDLTEEDMEKCQGEFDKLSQSVNTIKGMLNDLIYNVQEASAQVGIGTSEIASATENLSNGTTAQAASIDQAAQAVNDIADRIENNSEKEKLVESNLHDLDLLIKNSNDNMSELINVVNEVATMSNDIRKIIGTIESIAFQTNILALNASVEAARAGENGKGFAVVADEVGNLAKKSSEASKQTSELIEKCLQGINDITEHANSTFEHLEKVVTNAEEISSAFEEIAADTGEQATRSANIRNEINKISDVVQTNMATSEETAAATEEVSAQADNLSMMVKRFKVDKF